VSSPLREDDDSKINQVHPSDRRHKVRVLGDPIKWSFIQMLRLILFYKC
jgi:hypothetical protein